MLRYILFDVGLFETEAERASSQKRVLCLLEALVWIDRIYLREHPETPLIYKSGIQYKVPAQFEREDVPEVDALREFLKDRGAPAKVQAALSSLANQCGGGEHFRDIGRIIENGGGDCDNVASWRVAELRERGISAKPYITWRQRPDGGYTYHVIVMFPDGSSEDPSLLLGMGGDARAVDRAVEEKKLGERVADFLSGDFSTTFGPPAGASTVLGGAPITSPVQSVQNFNQLQYTIPFQTDDSYEDWSPTRPQAFYAHPLYPNLPTTPGGGPIFNALYRGEDYDWEDRFDGLPSLARRRIRSRGRRST